MTHRFAAPPRPRVQSVQLGPGEAAQTPTTHSTSTKNAAMHNAYEEAQETLEVLWRENSILRQEKMEAQAALEEAEASLAREESRILQVQVELHQLKGTSPAEVRSRSDALRVHERLVGDLNEMEVQLGCTNRQAAEAVKGLQVQLRDAQLHLEDSLVG